MLTTIKKKIKEYQNQYSYVHRDDRKEYQKILFDDKREFLNSLKYPCVKCGEDRPWIIDFHHINPKNKCFTVGNKYRGNIEVIQAEVEKCICLCRNCHAEFHWIYGAVPKYPELALNEYLAQ